MLEFFISAEPFLRKRASIDKPICLSDTGEPQRHIHRNRDSRKRKAYKTTPNSHTTNEGLGARRRGQAVVEINFPSLHQSVVHHLQSGAPRFFLDFYFQRFTLGFALHFKDTATIAKKFFKRVSRTLTETERGFELT